jgi:uncharacterized membrane protein (DUF106 family)
MAEKKPMNPMMYMLLVMVLMIAITPFSGAIGQYMNIVLYPLIGFNGLYPMLSIFCGGVILVIFNTLVAHLTTDWRAQAKSQQVSKAFQQEMRQAQIDKDAKKLNELRKRQQEIMEMSMAQSSKQMRLMPFTLFVAILIFFWLYYFISNIGDPVIAAPWGEWDLLATSFIFPNYIWFYTFITFPLGQVLRKALQLMRLRRETSANNE